MKDSRLEALLLGARPLTDGEYTELTRKVMAHLKQHAALDKQRAPARRPRRNVFTRMRALHGASLGVAILVALILLTSAAYASVRFVPELIKVIDKKLNSSGNLDYSVPAFADCYAPGQLKLDTFEVFPSAGLSDEDVEKTLRAKCELMGMDAFASDTWPTYGEHKEWKDGDTIFYTRPDRLGKIKSISDHTVTFVYGNGERPTEYKTFENKPLEVYSRNERIKLGALKSGDLVFSMVRVSEIYTTGDRHAWSQDGVQFESGPIAQPQPRGIVGIVKLSLPERYYYEMQKYVHEVQPCEGNSDERCSRRPGVSVDVFPRDEGEGGRNPFAAGQGTDGRSVGRGIMGTVSAINEDSFNITASTGATYTMHIPRSIIEDYNTKYAPGYVPTLAPDIHAIQVNIGSLVSIAYAQEPGADRKSINAGDIIRVMLLTDLSPKGSKR